MYRAAAPAPASLWQHMLERWQSWLAERCDPHLCEDVGRPVITPPTGDASPPMQAWAG